jgi:hypothetical protein
MSKILSTGNVRLFLNTLLYVQASIFPDPYHEVSSVDLICPIVGFDTVKKFVGLTHWKCVFNESRRYSLIL